MEKRRQLVGWFLTTFIIGLCLSGVFALQIDRTNQQTIQKAARQEMLRITEEVVARINLYQYGLRAVRGAVLTAGETDISRELFRRYSQTRDITTEFPGAHGFGFIRRVTPEQEADFLAKARADGKPDFTIRQLSPHSGDRYLIQYIEPIEQNFAAIGLDIASEKHRREAAEAAVRNGSATITGPITLVQESGAPSQSFLVLMPVYRSGATPSTLAERKTKVFGWAYAPLLMKEVLANLSVNTRSTDLVLSDITHTRNREVFFTSKKDSTPRVITQSIERDVMGRRWEIELGIHPSFIQQLNLVNARFVLLMGLFARY